MLPCAPTAGSPFTNPTGTVPVSDAHSFKVRDHALNVLFETDFTSGVWHNFAVAVDWDALTLEVFYSQDGDALASVTETESNPTAVSGANGQGDFHFTVLKVRWHSATRSCRWVGADGCYLLSW